MASLKPHRISTLLRLVPRADIRILDIGCGSHSPSITKKWFSNCHYTGVDRDQSYNYDQHDLQALDEFFAIDLSAGDVSSLPDAAYDVLIMSHIIEHLENGDEVLVELLAKLRPGGIAYVEWPNPRSVDFPSMRETLNFYDDPTHVRIFSVPEISDLLTANGLVVIQSGTIRRLIHVLLMPVKAAVQLITRGYVRGGTFWDLYGFAVHVVASKP